jgi:hypothetical protein
MTTALRSFHPWPTRAAGRLALAQIFRATALLLQRLADRVTPREVSTVGAPLTLPRVEFHADAAAPEGALYVDGVLFGHLPGVHRL